MTRRRYRKRQVRPGETLSTLLALGGVLLTLGVFTLPQDMALQAALLLLMIAVLGGAGFYYFSYRKLLMRREGLRQLRIDDVDTMAGVTFEAYVAELFRLQGYKIQTTALSGDYGIDLIIAKDGIRTGVQTKRYSKPVNQAAVREAVAGMKQYKCSRSMVVTNNYFTKFAVDLAKTNECVLIDRDALVEMVAMRER